MQLIESLTYQPAELSFGTSGLRGLVSDMTDLECYINVRGFLEFLRSEDALRPGETVCLAGDLRDSTPRIMGVMTKAVQEAGFTTLNYGLIPTPAVASYALSQNAPCIMVTGSHIPADRNGIKFYKRGGEVLKNDEAAIHAFVAGVRRTEYERNAEESDFASDGSCRQSMAAPEVSDDARNNFIERYKTVFPADSFAGKQVIIYQQSAVGRDLLVEILEALGAEAVPIERSDTFIPIDTENVTEVEQALFKSFSERYPKAFAIISTDGDSDRPFVIDETGTFHRGDVLGCVVMDYLDAKFAAVPVSSNDAIDDFCAEHRIPLMHTKIGSPYVIVAMQAAPKAEWPVVGWEVNGGFLTGCDIEVNGGTLPALPTRDATLPILCALHAAVKRNVPVSSIFAALPKRYTGAGLIDVVPEQVQEFKALSSDESAMLHIASKLFGTSALGEIDRVDVTDGLRLIFKSPVVLHLRPSGNAPQFRVYTNADSQQQADQLVTEGVAPGGYIEQLLEAVQNHVGEYDT